MSQTLRIVHAVTSAGFAGVERYVADLAGAQHAAGHRVAVIGGDPAAMRSVLGTDRIPLRAASSVRATIRALNRWADCDVVHVHMTATELAATLATAARSVPVVTTRHFARRRGASVGGRCVAPLIERRVDAQVAISQYVADRIEGVAAVVRTGVPVREDLPGPRGRERTVLVAQRLEPEKRTDMALRAFARASLADEGWRLAVAGDGSQEESLRSLARELRIGASVDFLGRRSDVGDLMARASVLLAPCPVEGLGLSVLEAMAAGLPVVAAASGGHLETVGAVEGAALYRPDDPSDGGLLLAALAGDPGRRAEYGERLRARQRSAFTSVAQVAAMDQVYRSLR